MTPTNCTPPTPLSELPFTVRQRMEHIERCLFWKGELQRADVVKTFGVNPAQAATDFRDYMLLAPGNMDYNKSKKRYLPLPGFTPRFIRPATLDDFVGMGSPIIKVETWPLPSRIASPEVLQAVVGAIREHQALEVQYQSMTDPAPSWRWLSPHAFASDGERWHVRAFCHKRSEFRDFVLGRIVTTRGKRESEMDAGEDIEWNTFVDVILAPNPALSGNQQAAIASEYNIPPGERLDIKLRKSMLFYLQARFSPEPMGPAAAHQLIVIEPASIR